jgi:hypothetical protein
MYAQHIAQVCIKLGSGALWAWQGPDRGLQGGAVAPLPLAAQAYSGMIEK